MALTEKSEYKVEVIPPYSILQVRRADIILKDGVEVARSYHRHILNPGQDVSGEALVVQQVASAVHTEETCKLYHDEVIQPQIDAAKAEAKAKAEAAAKTLKEKVTEAVDNIEKPSTLPAPEEGGPGTADIKRQKKR